MAKNVAGIANKISPGAVPSGVTGPLGALAGAYGIYNAIEHPSVSSALGGAAGAAAIGAEGANLMGDAAMASTLGPVGWALGGAALAAGLGQMAYNALDPRNVPDMVNPAMSAAMGMPVNPKGKLPSGNSILTDTNAGGRMGVGLGSEQTGGSGEIYFVEPSAAKNQTNNTAYKWLGQSDSGNLERDAKTLQGNNFNADISALENMQGIYNSTGGQHMWGQDFSAWAQDMNQMLDSVSAGTYWGRTA